MILLLEYGGLWVDADTIFLRDLSPFWPYEWAERWSLHVAHNTAMLRLFAGSKIGQQSARCPILMHDVTCCMPFLWLWGRC